MRTYYRPKRSFHSLKTNEIYLFCGRSFLKPFARKSMPTCCKRATGKSFTLVRY